MISDMQAVPAYSFPLALIYFGQLAGFSLSILVVSNWRLERSSMIWLGANLCATIGLGAGYPLNTPYSPNAPFIAVALTIINLGMKRLALLPRQKNGQLVGDHRATFVFIAFGVFASFITPVPYRSMLACLLSAALSFWTIPAVLRNRRWHGYWGRSVMFAASIVATVLFLLRFIITLSRGFAEPTMPRIESANGQAIMIVGMIASSAILQAGFLGMLTAQQSRARQLSAKRLARASERMLSARKHAKQIQHLADQRLNLLNLLTHEVRQPLHNAQAGLQSFLTEIERGAYSPERLSSAARRTQGVLDGITLSLSNAITGTRLIEEDSISQLRHTSMAETAIMAQLDCPPYLQQRVQLAVPSPEMFIDVEPVLLRLALRNLLDNALKYSPSGTLVTFEVLEEELELGVLFRVTNDVQNDQLLEGEIFERARRGGPTNAEGQGLGLYIVKRVAHLHGGWVKMRRSGGSQVVFELFLPG